MACLHAKQQWKKTQNVAEDTGAQFLQNCGLKIWISVSQQGRAGALPRDYDQLES